MRGLGGGRTKTKRSRHGNRAPIAICVGEGRFQPSIYFAHLGNGLEQNEFTVVGVGGWDWEQAYEAINIYDKHARPHALARVCS